MVDLDFIHEYPYAELSSQDGLFNFKIYSYNYAYPDAENKYDSDWHRNYLIATFPAFNAKMNEIILEGKLVKSYITELEQLVAMKIDEVIFEPTEPYFSLTLTLNKNRKILANGFIQYPVGYGVVLKFEFETDLTYLEKFMKGLKSILRMFPPKK